MYGLSPVSLSRSASKREARTFSSEVTSMKTGLPAGAVPLIRSVPPLSSEVLSTWIVTMGSAGPGAGRTVSLEPWAFTSSEASAALAAP